LGTEALLIHNIQYSFINLGQYIGGATAASCLIFWKRAEYADKQGGIFYIHMGLCLGVSLICMLVASLYSEGILTHFSVNPEYYSLATKYFNLGLLNMGLQAMYLALIGIVIAVSRERLSLIFSIVLLLLNIVADSLIIHLFFTGGTSPQHIMLPMLAIIISNITLIAVSVGIIYWLLRNKIKQVNYGNSREILKIWANELGGAFISAAYPIVYLFQLGLVKTEGSLLVTYQLLTQLTAVFCIPILATMQVALREASAQQGMPRSSYIPLWVRELSYFGFIPTEILLLFFMMFPVLFIQLVFGYLTPADHVSFIVMYLFASMIGQIGNMLTVSIRAQKKSHLVTTGYFISDVIILVGGTQLLFFAHIDMPMTTGLVMLLYTCVYTLMNAYFAFRK
jgi:Na+-driven multidrug efflux pump